jgi:hypothetical protein
VADVDRPALETRWQEGWRRDERDVGAKRSEGEDVAARHAAVLDVADNRDTATRETA